MPFSYGELTVRGRDGRRVAITDCKLEPLNLLIPGNAPIVVPKKHAWSSPSQQVKTTNRSDKLKREIAPDEYEADSEEEDIDDLDDETTPLIQKAPSKGKSKARCKKDGISDKKEKEAEHRRRAERHEKRAELERQEAAEDHKRLQKRIAKQEAYILRLKARYQNAGGKTTKDSGRSSCSKKSNSKQEASNKKVAKSSDSDDGATTDGSAVVREMLANMKIRAGGKDNPRFFEQPGEMPWSVSDDSQLIALKSDSSNTYAVIAECMQRGAGEVKRRYKYLKDCDFKIPGADEDVEATTTTEAEKTATGEDRTTDAEKTGEETTDVEQTGGETTDAEKTNDQKDETADANKPKEHEKGRDNDAWTEETDAQLWKLKDEGKTWAEIHEIMGKGKSGLKDRYKHLKSIDFNVPDEPVDPAKPDGNDENKDDAADVANDFMARASAFVEKQMEAASAAANNQPSSARSQKGSNHQPSPTAFPTGYYNSNAFDPGTNAYIAQYSRNLLADADAGRRSIPEPDEVFDEDDCILLALADSRRRENRWLDIQADYYNVTGRMVPLEVLRWKLVGGQEPEGALGDGEDA